MAAPRNQWYIGAMATGDTGLLCGGFYVSHCFLRTADGTAVALADAVRMGVPLSMGKVFGASLPYLLRINKAESAPGALAGTIVCSSWFIVR